MEKKLILIAVLVAGLCFTQSAIAGCGSCEGDAGKKEGSHKHEEGSHKVVEALAGTTSANVATALDAYIAANGKDGVLSLTDAAGNAKSVTLVKLYDKVCKVDDHGCACAEFKDAESGDSVKVILDLSGEGESVSVTAAKIASGDLKCSLADKKCSLADKKDKKAEGSHKVMEGSHKKGE